MYNSKVVVSVGTRVVTHSSKRKVRDFNWRW